MKTKTNMSTSVSEISSDTAIHQKRTLAFVNHFVIKTIQFMNNFATQCEQKLIDFELKMQKIEASLTILESKLASIPDLKQTQNEEIKYEESETVKVDVCKENNIKKEETDTNTDAEDLPADLPPQRDPIYERFFKMVQVGVPVQAVKLKIIQEGLDPTVLD